MAETYQPGGDAVVRMRTPDNARATEGETARIFGFDFVGGDDGDFYATLPAWAAEAEIAAGRVQFVRHTEAPSPSGTGASRSRHAKPGEGSGE